MVYIKNIYMISLYLKSCDNNWNAGYFLSAMKNHQLSSCDFLPANLPSSVNWLPGQPTVLNRGTDAKDENIQHPQDISSTFPPENQGGGPMEKEIKTG